MIWAHNTHRWPTAVNASQWPAALKNYVNLRNSLLRDQFRILRVPLMGWHHLAAREWEISGAVYGYFSPF
jgi:hypothetical protein